MRKIKINVEVVTGFLGAGKTSFINSLISESQVEGEKLIVFQMEAGNNEISKSSDFNYPLKLIKLNEVSELKQEMIYSIKKYNPHRIIIEYNGTDSLDELFKILNEKIYREYSKISTVFFVADSKTINSYVDNMKNFLGPFIEASNMIVLNNIDYCKKDLLDDGLKKIRGINPKAYILRVNNKYILNSLLRESNVLDNGYIKKFKTKIRNYKS